VRWSGAGIRIAAAAALGLSLLGCGAARSEATRQKDEQFVQSVQSAAPDVESFRNATQLVRLGEAACAGFDSGVSYQQLADRLVVTEGPNPLPTEDLGAVITAAVRTFCPKYDGLVK